MGLKVVGANDILIAVRRTLWISTGKAISFLILMGLVLTWLSDNPKYALIGSVLVVVVIFQVIVGQYIPVRNRHESLLSRYGAVYVAEAQHAIKRFGIRELLRTRWFATYADEFCRRRTELSNKS